MTQDEMMAELEKKYGPATKNPDGSVSFVLTGGQCPPQNHSEETFRMPPLPMQPGQSVGAPIVLPSPAPRQQSVVVPVLLALIFAVEAVWLVIELVGRR